MSCSIFLFLLILILAQDQGKLKFRTYKLVFSFITLISLILIGPEMKIALVYSKPMDGQAQFVNPLITSSSFHHGNKIMNPER